MSRQASRNGKAAAMKLTWMKSLFSIPCLPFLMRLPHGYTEDPANHFCRIFPDGARPVFDAYIVPWRDTEPVRHVLLVGGILVLPAGWEAVVGRDAGVTAVNLHGAVRDFQVYRFAGILVRTGIPVVFKHHMEVNVHFPAVYPCGNLIRNGRQGMEKRLFIQVSSQPLPIRQEEPVFHPPGGHAGQVPYLSMGRCTHQKLGGCRPYEPLDLCVVLFLIDIIHQPLHPVVKRQPQCGWLSLLCLQPGDE